MKTGVKRLIAWQKAYRLGLSSYKMVGSFPEIERFGLSNQIRRAATSVSINIAEGYERSHRKEYLRFLGIAKGSLGELETLFLFAKDLKYVSTTAYVEIETQRQETIKLLQGLINSLKI